MEDHGRLKDHHFQDVHFFFTLPNQSNFSKLTKLFTKHTKDIIP